MREIASDLRFAGRMLAKNPGFSAVIVLTLALGIGANTAIFSLMDQVLLRPLPVRAPQELMVLDGPGIFTGNSEDHPTFSYPMYLALRDGGGAAFTGLVARYESEATLGWRGRTERVSSEAVSGNYFGELGLSPALGRAFTPDDDRTPGGHPLVMLSHGFWTRRFASDPGVLGQALSVNGQPMTIVGIAPAGFQGLEVGRAADVFVPITMRRTLTPTRDADVFDWRSRWLKVVGRLQPGVDAQQAKAAIDVVYRQALAEDVKTLPHYPPERRAEFLAKQIALTPGAAGFSELRQEVTAPLVVLMGMVGLVLLIACGNVANLLMARATARQKEVAIRLSLGASRARLVRQLLVESLVLSLLGAVAGIVVATWTGDLLLRALPFDSATRVFSAEPDLRVGVFTLVVGVATGLVFGLAPALQLTRPGVASTLKDEAAAVVGGSGGRLRRGLVVAQVALSLLLLVGAGLFARSLRNLRALDPGFQADRLIAFSVNPALSGYDEARVQSFAVRVQEELRALPGVKNAAPSTGRLMSNSAWRRTVKVEGKERRDGEDWSPQNSLVGPGFFDTVGFTLLAGRDFTPSDSATAPKVAVVNEAFARFFFDGANPVGRRFGFGRDEGYAIEIVGLVKDAKVNNLRDETPRYVYVPLAQQDRVSGYSFYVRSALPETAVIPSVRQALQRLDAQIPVYDLETMETQIGESLFAERMVAVLSAAFGLLATLLAAVGLYGVMSYSVARRTREIGIRLALGAPRERVLGMVLREVGTLGAWGLGLGLPLSLALARLLAAQLFGLPPHDPVTLASATALLAGVTVLAGLVPARRAMRVDPMLALRYE